MMRTEKQARIHPLREMGATPGRSLVRVSKHTPLLHYSPLFHYSPRFIYSLVLNTIAHV